jgi:formylglycine-generating enzyme
MAAVWRVAWALVLVGCQAEVAGPAVVYVPASREDRTPEPAVPAETMVLIPEGPFLRGCSPADRGCYDNESPARPIRLSAFYIDRTEVTVERYAACVAAGACSEANVGMSTKSVTTSRPPTGDNESHTSGTATSSGCNYRHIERLHHPMNCVSWHEAKAFCEWYGKRLPTEAEWEKAARGASDDRIYPWGNAAPSCNLAVVKQSGTRCDTNLTARIGSRPGGASPFGVLDMVGNVWEWVSDYYDRDYYTRAPNVDPQGPEEGKFRVMRGGGFTDFPHDGIDPLRVSNRYSYVPQVRFERLGVRCARSAGQSGQAQGREARR